jgi:hypothetical protein
MQGATLHLFRENPQTYPQDLWITAWPHFC